MSQEKTRIPLWFAIGITFFLLGYLWIAEGSQVTPNPFYQFGVIVILSTGIFFSVKRYRRTHDSSISFIKALGVGLGTTATTALFYGTFIFFYSLFAPKFSYSFVEDHHMSLLLKATYHFGIAFMVTIVVGIVASLTSAIYLKRSREKIEMKDQRENLEA